MLAWGRKSKSPPKEISDSRFRFVPTTFGIGHKRIRVGTRRAVRDFRPTYQVPDLNETVYPTVMLISQWLESLEGRDMGFTPCVKNQSLCCKITPGLVWCEAAVHVRALSSRSALQAHFSPDKFLYFNNPHSLIPSLCKEFTQDSSRLCQPTGSSVALLPFENEGYPMSMAKLDTRHNRTIEALPYHMPNKSLPFAHLVPQLIY
jgi:hypothetical protein